MEDALAFRCSENDTVLVAAGKTMAVDLNNGVISNDIITATKAVVDVISMTVFLFLQINKSKLFLPASSS